MANEIDKETLIYRLTDYADEILRMEGAVSDYSIQEKNELEAILAEKQMGTLDEWIDNYREGQTPLHERLENYYQRMSSESTSVDSADLEFQQLNWELRKQGAIKLSDWLSDRAQLQSDINASIDQQALSTGETQGSSIDNLNQESTSVNVWAAAENREKGNKIKDPQGYEKEKRDAGIRSFVTMDFKSKDLGPEDAEPIKKKIEAV